jgi:hypothetical protein
VTRPTRLQIGAWAALFFCVTLLVQALVLGPSRNAESQGVGFRGVLLLAAAVIVVVGLDSWYRHLDPTLGLIALLAGLSATVPLLIVSAGQLLAFGARPPEQAPTPTAVVANALFGIWLIIGGALLAQLGRRRVTGVVGVLAGIGFVSNAAGLALGHLSPEIGAGAANELQAINFLLIFVLLYFVLIWRIAHVRPATGTEPT